MEKFLKPGIGESAGIGIRMPFGFPLFLPDLTPDARNLIPEINK